MIGLLLLACTGPVDSGERMDSGDGDVVRLGGSVLLGPERACAAPVLGRDRLVDEAAARGLSWTHTDDPLLRDHKVSGGGVAVADLDRDGDLDIVLGNVRGPPRLFANDGSANFEPVVVPGPEVLHYRDHIAMTVAHDDDGDGLPELFLLAPAAVWRLANLGDLAFGMPEAVLRLEGDDIAARFTAALGDGDGDGDLDWFLPGLDRIGDGDGQAFQLDPLLEAGPHHWLWRAEGGWAAQRADLPAPDALSLLALLTDRDLDGDADLLVGSDRAESGERAPTTFFRRDGETWSSDGPDVGVGQAMSAMGAAIADLNEDGLPDYAIADFRGHRLLLSRGNRWLEAQETAGLAPPLADGQPAWWFGWSTELADLDHDGHPELLTAAGLPFQPSELPADSALPQRDGLWWGQPDATFAPSTDPAFADPRDHIGLVAADLDGDGWTDVVVSGTDGPARLWMNRCGANAHLEVRLEGPPENTAGIGAWVQVSAGSRHWRTELQGPRGLMQGPNRVIVGLGDYTAADSLSVRWPDGLVTVAENIAVNRWVLARHPDAVSVP